MRILTFKRVLGLAAIGYGYQYAKKHGGVRNAWNEVVGKARMAIDRGRESIRDTADQTGMGATSRSSGMAGTSADIGEDARSTTGYSSGYTTGGGYGGGTVGGGGGNRGL
jgi:hypothetical protein